MLVLSRVVVTTHFLFFNLTLFTRWTKGDKVSHDTPTKTPTVDLDDGTKATKYMETSADRKTKEISKYCLSPNQPFITRSI